MTEDTTSRTAALGKARKLLNLYRGASGGEQDKARGVLERLLVNNDLTLADLEPHLPSSTDPRDAEAAHESSLLLLNLESGSEAEASEALSELVDDPDLSEEQRARVLSRLSLEKLVESRAPAWLAALGDEEVEEEHLLESARALTEQAVLAVGGMSLAEVVRSFVTGDARRRARPERTLRADDALHAAYLAELCRLASRLPARTVQDEEGGWSVLANVSVAELGQVRARTDRDALARRLERAARDAARDDFPA